jgi:predicted DNA-binding WGR domain protein
MPRYEFSEGSSNKFWEITLNKKTFTTTYGKTGTAGQSASKSWPSEVEAKRQYDKLIAEKEKKGYVLVGGGAATSRAASQAGAKTPPALTATSSPRNPALEKAIFEHPEAVEGYEAYGAWLKTQGDPMAELVTIQIGLSKDRQDKALKKQEAAFLTKHAAVLYGALAKPLEGGELLASWRYGFLDALILGGEEGAEDKPEDLYPALMKLTAARFLQSLSFWAFDDDSGQPSYQKLLTQMERLGLPPSLRRLSFDMKDYQISWTALGKLDKLYPQLAKLESLFLHVGSMNLGEIKLPELRRLEIQTGGFTKKNLASVSESSLPSLETMILYFGVDEYGCDCKPKDLKGLLEGDKAPKVKRLGLCNSAFADELPGLLVASKILPRLKHLDLSMGVFSDQGAQVLLDEKRAFLHLESLNLKQSYLSEIMCERLRTTFAQVDLDEQNSDDDEEERYVQMME